MAPESDLADGVSQQDKASPITKEGAPRWFLSMLGRGLAVIVQPLGRWRTQILLRGYGLCVLYMFLVQYHWRWRGEHRSIQVTWEALRFYFTGRPVEEQLFTLAGALLLVLGARGGTVAFMAVSSTLLLRINMVDPGLFPAVELVLFALLPLFGCLVVSGEIVRACLSRSPVDLRSLRVDEVVVWICRSAMLTTMFFVVLHKSNRDFLDPAMSCENVIAGWLVENWGPTGQVLKAIGSPALTLFVEATIPLVLVWQPALAILYLSTFFAVLGLVGAPSTAGILIVLSWSFLSDEDGNVLSRHQRGILLGTGILWLLIYSVSLNIYTGRSMSRELMALFEIMVVVAWVSAAVLLAEQWRRVQSMRDVLLGWFARRRPLVPGRWMRLGLTAVATVVLLINGMSPYLGLRFNYSFAMWSNLRADRLRWNSLVVPSWVQMWPVTEEFVEIQDVRFAPWTTQLFDASTVSVRQFLQAVVPNMGRAGVRLDLSFSYAGEPYAFQDAAHDASFGTLLRRMRSEQTEGSEAAAASVTIERAILETENPMQGASARQATELYDRRLEPALFSTTAFREVIGESLRVRQNLHLRFAYQGKTYRVANTLGNEEFLRFASTLPENNLFPGKLTITSAQPCFH